MQLYHGLGWNEHCMMDRSNRTGISGSRRFVEPSAEEGVSIECYEFMA